MKIEKKNYTIYLIMLLVAGLLISFVLNLGTQFEELEETVLGGNKADAFTLFKEIFIANLHTPVSILLIQIVVILSTVRLFSVLFKFLGQPGVIGEIVAGIVLGPSLLGYYFPEYLTALFPSSSLTNLELLSQIGLILFMFVIGMELDFGMLKQKMSKTLVISHAGISLSFFLGIVAALFVYEEYVSHQTPFIPFALFMGISMSITAFPVLARIIQERNMSQKPIGVLAIGSAANDDVTAWCLLAVVISIAKAGSFESALYSIGLTICFIVVMFAIIRPFLHKVGEVYAHTEVINKTFVGFIFLVLIISATLAQLIGIHSLFGAFIAGVVMPSNMGFRKVMMEKIEDVSLILFLPLFFAFTGLRIEIGLINSVELLVICLVFILFAVTGKLGGCTLGARVVGETWRDSLTIGTLMNTRGLMELVVLNIGYEMGILPQPIFVALVIMALVTTFMTTPLLILQEKWVQKTKTNQVKRRKIMLFFGRPQSGATLLEVANILFSKQLKESKMVAAHFTVDTDLNPIKAKQYRKESFTPINEKATQLQLSIDNLYKVTNKVTQEIVRLVEQEHVSFLLLGAGQNQSTAGNSEIKERCENSFMPKIICKLFSRIGNYSLRLPGTLFKEKVDKIIEQVTCGVGLFFNKEFETLETIIVILQDEDDAFLFTTLDAIAQNKQVKIVLLLLQIPRRNSLMQHKIEQAWAKYRDQITVLNSTNRALIINDQHSIALISHATYTTSIEDTEFQKALPSYLVIRPKVKKERIQSV